MKQITIVSGKGGVGKSSICASLGICLSKTKKIICADCDVDASNLALVFGIKEKNFREWREITTNKKAIFDYNKCNSCKKCIESCYFNAIKWNDELNRPYLDEFKCEGCGVCKLVCPNNAVKLIDVKNAKIGYAKTKYGFWVVSGQLNIGESGSGKVVSEVKKLAFDRMEENTDIMLVDAAAGIGCPVIASIVGSDYCLAITEPTPSAFSDLKRVLEIVFHFNIPCGIVINKFDLNAGFAKKIENFAKQNNIEIICKIPYNKSFSEALANLEPIVEYNPDLKKYFEKIMKVFL